MRREGGRLPLVGRGDGRGVGGGPQGKGQDPVPRGGGQPPAKQVSPAPTPLLQDSVSASAGLSPRPLPTLAMERSTYRRFGDSGNSGGTAIASGVRGICLCVLNLEGPG